MLASPVTIASALSEHPPVTRRGPGERTESQVSRRSNAVNVQVHAFALGGPGCLGGGNSGRIGRCEAENPGGRGGVAPKPAAYGRRGTRSGYGRRGTGSEYGRRGTGSGSLRRTGAAGQEVRVVTAWRCWFAGRWWATISEGFSQGRTQAHDHGRMHSTEHDYERPDFAHCYVSLKH